MKQRRRRVLQERRRRTDRCARRRERHGSEPLRAFEPLPPAKFKNPVTAQYAEAFAKLEAGDAGAMPSFASLVGQYADDALAGFHLKRLLNGAKGVRMQLE